MSFGKIPTIPAHQGATSDNPIVGRRDRAIEAGKCRNPPVPRAPRAKPRANSAGALTRAQSKDSLSSLNSSASRMSEHRRPSDASPFSHARVNCLDRETTAVENQRFEMGPASRSTSVDRRQDHSRGHALGKANDANQGMPWQQPQERNDTQPKARRSTLHHEQKAADQGLEWVPQQPAKEEVSDGRGHARINVHKRELGNAAQTLEFCPQASVASAQAAAAVSGGYHGRRSVLARERQEDSGDVPRAAGYADGNAPAYNRKSMLPAFVAREPLSAH